MFSLYKTYMLLPPPCLKSVITYYCARCRIIMSACHLLMASAFSIDVDAPMFAAAIRRFITPPPRYDAAMPLLTMRCL